MKISPIFAPFALALGLSFFLSPFVAFAKEEHPHMHEASTALRAAQTSANPMQDLTEARRRLNFAKENKGGYRIEALRRTDAAIAALKEGKRIEANKQITEALSAIEKGVALHPRDRRRR